MIHEGRVHSVGQHGTVVEFNQPEACVTCSGGQGCGAGLFAQLLTARPFTQQTKSIPQRINVTNPLNAGPGQQVQVELADSALPVCAVAGGFLPALLVIVGAIAGHYAGPLLGLTPDLSAFFGLVIGLSAGFYLSRCGGVFAYETGYISAVVVKVDDSHLIALPKPMHSREESGTHSP